MNTTKQGTVSGEKSIFPDGRYLDGNGGNHKSALLKDILRYYVQGGNYLKHMLLQEVAFYYTGGDVETFLQKNGYELQQVITDIDELKFYLEKNKDLRKQIVSGEINISILYEGVFPQKIVLAKRTIPEAKVLEKINEIRDELKAISGDILQMSL